MTLTSRTGRLVALACWGAFLAWLQLGGQVARYLGPRTAWIVPVGAIALIAATAAYAWYTRDAPVARQALRRPEVLGLAALLTPVIVGLCLADATLGSLAAANKLSARGVDFSRLAGSLSTGSSNVDFLVIRAAEEDKKVAAERGIVAGRPVDLTGFVLAPAPSATAPLRLARFYITCCVADSVAIDVPVYPARGAAAFRKDQWLHVTGVLQRRGKAFVVEGARVRVVRAPKKPYLVFQV